MDVQKIGMFLAQLRKEQGMTQEQLGEKLGVTNKTVSRWENGNYLPPVEMLQFLSELYGLTINEILSCRRLDDGAYRQMAEENIKSALNASSFTLKEKIEFYRKKWLKDHFWGRLLARILIYGLLAAAIMTHALLWVIVFVAANIGYTLIERNRMMIYVESHAYDGSGSQ